MKHSTRRGVGAALATLAAFGCNANPLPPSSIAGEQLPGRGTAVPVPDDPELRSGFEAWTVLCAPCHGQGGKGDGPMAGFLLVDPGDLTDPGGLTYTTDHERIRVIAEGIEDSLMIGWKEVLSPGEIEAVNAYLYSLQGSP